MKLARMRNSDRNTVAGHIPPGVWLAPDGNSPGTRLGHWPASQPLRVSAA